MLSQGFRVQHRSLPSELLITHRSAAGSDSRPPVPILTFLSNVVLETLRVVNQGFFKPPALAVGNVNSFLPDMILRYLCVASHYRIQ